MFNWHVKKLKRTNPIIKSSAVKLKWLNEKTLTKLKIVLALVRSSTR